MRAEGDRCDRKHRKASTTLAESAADGRNAGMRAGAVGRRPG